MTWNTGHRWRQAACASLCLLAVVPSAASEHEHVHSTPPTEADALDPQIAPVATRLWNDLVCLCGRCQRLTLAACRCPDAAAERQTVVKLLRGRDLASPEAAQASYQAVVQTYVTRYGGRHVLASEAASGAPEDWPAWVVSVALVALACAGFVILEIRRQRRKRPRSRSRR